MANFQIDFDSSTVVYCPSDTVTGKVTLDIPDGFKARKVRMVMIGKAYTFWEGEAKNNTKIKNSDIVRVRHNCADHKGKIVYCEYECISWKSDDNKHDMPSGLYSFPFSFKLPNYCPPSFEGDLGFIRYFVKVEIDRPWKFDDKFVRCFTVLPRIDLAQIPKSLIPSRRHVCEETGSVLWKKGLVKMEISLPKQGFVCGEQLPISVKVENKTPRRFKHLHIKLIQHLNYTGFRDGLMDHSMSIGDEKKVPTITERKLTYARMNAQVRIEERKILEDNMGVRMEEHSTTEIQKTLTIPPLTPSIKSCELIDVEYILKAKISTGGTFGTVIKVEIPFIIGTHPNDLNGKTYKMDYKKSVFGYNATKLKNRSVQKYAPLYPVYKLK